MEQYRKAATTIGLQLCRDALWLNGSCNWIGSSTEDYYGTSKAYAKALSTNFYDGTAGVAYFLTCLHQVHADALVEKTAHGALQQIIDNELSEKKEMDLLYAKLGFHTGWPGCAYVLQKAGEHFKNNNYLDAAKQLLHQSMHLPQEYWGLDVIDGAAGAVTALTTLHRKFQNKDLKEFIVALGNYLINKGEKNSQGLSWNTMADKTANLTGYAHGAAGFAHAFSELFQLTGDKKYLDLIKEITRYEDAHFNAEQQNWPDFRSQTAYQQTPQPVQPSCGLAWCHGAPGIGLSRLRTYELTNLETNKKDAEIAINTTLQLNRLDAIGNYSLCHGLFGNAELLVYAAQIFNRPDYLKNVYQQADECIANFLEKSMPIPNGLQTQAETPDFMMGSSGIGYFFLRLLDPETFPNMLLITN